MRFGDRKHMYKVSAKGFTEGVWCSSIEGRIVQNEIRNYIHGLLAV